MSLVREVLKYATKTLEPMGARTARLDAEILLAHVLGASRENLLTRWDENVSPDTLEKFVGLIERRKSREPIARITGVQEFWSLPFKINDATLIPRPDSETLVEAVLKKIPNESPFRILDLGTGSGCLLLSILSMRKNATGLGVDANEHALECARENAKDLNLQDRATFESFNWLSDDPGDWKFDLILSNPPYIETREIETLAPEVSKYDPLLALDGGGDGLFHYRVLIPLSCGLLKGRGWVFFEIGETQETEVRKILKDAHFTNLETHHDLAGKPRVVAGFIPFD
ncbi:MAG: peptide chain release factor N(5)-glutamine methyltransferase [Sphingomonadales bacterium]